MQRESETDIFANAPRLLTALPPLHQTLANATKTEVDAHRQAYTPRKLKNGTRWSETIITTAPAAKHRQIHFRQQQIKPIFYETGVEYKIKQRFLFEDKCKTRASSLEL